MRDGRAVPVGDHPVDRRAGQGGAGHMARSFPDPPRHQFILTRRSPTASIRCSGMESDDRRPPIGLVLLPLHHARGADSSRKARHRAALLAQSVHRGPRDLGIHRRRSGCRSFRSPAAQTADIDNGPKPATRSNRDFAAGTVDLQSTGHLVADAFTRADLRVAASTQAATDVEETSILGRRLRPPLPPQRRQFLRTID